MKAAAANELNGVKFASPQAKKRAIERAQSGEVRKLLEALGERELPFPKIFPGDKRITIDMVDPAIDEWVEHKQKQVAEQKVNSGSIEQGVMNALSDDGRVFINALIPFIGDGEGGSKRESRRLGVFMILDELLTDGDLEAPNVSPESLWEVLEPAASAMKGHHFEYEDDNDLPILVCCEFEECKNVQVSQASKGVEGKQPRGHWLVEDDGLGNFTVNGHCSYCRQRRIARAKEEQSGFLAFLPLSTARGKARYKNRKAAEEREELRTQKAGTAFFEKVRRRVKKGVRGATAVL